MARPGHGFLAGPHPRAFAHRGWHIGDLEGLENTAAAFERAVVEGFSYVETDVHVTADGVLVAFHDASLDRVTDGRGLVGELPWRTVRRARIGGREPIPLLAELLHSFPTARFNIDAKADAAVGPLVDTVRRAGAADRVCLASFSDRRLAAIRRAAGPDVATSLGQRSVTRFVARAHHLPALPPLRGPVAVQVPVQYGRVTVTDRRFVELAHRAGLEVHVWTVDDPAQMHRLLDLGTDGLMTDRPDLLREVLRARGGWPDGARTLRI